MITQRAEATRRIEVAPEVLWATVSRMTGMEDWYPGMIAASEVDESTDVPTRVCVMQDGNRLHERIVARDTATRTFVYVIDAHPMPVRDVVGTIRIDARNGASLVTWDAQFVCDPGAAEDMKQMISALYERGLDSLADYQTRQGE